MIKQVLKRSYTIPCSTDFRDTVTELARRSHVNVGDLARSVALMMRQEDIKAFPDHGAPKVSDRETIIIKSGASKGRPWRRKPRLQVRMAPGFDIITIRRALGLALAMARGEIIVRLDGAKIAGGKKDAEMEQLQKNRDEMDRFRAMISALAFTTLSGGIKTRGEALYVLGFPPTSIPARETLRARFRTLATIYHPDSDVGDHDRMSQLNAAMDYLRRGGA